VRYVGRPERASPSEGTPAWHAGEQARIMAEAFEGYTQAATVTVTAEKDKHHE
jgi:2-oxoglutarate dehydrogenase E1 component